MVKKILNSKSVIKIFLATLFAVSSTTSAKSQIDKTIKDGIIIFRDATNAIKQLGGLIKETKKTTAEFNKNVTVTKSTKKPLVSDDQITKPKFKKGSFTNFAWEPVAQFEGQVFPAMIISMATYKGDVNEPFMNSVKSSALGFSFNASSPYIPLKWEIECSDKTYFDKVGGDFMIERANSVTDFMPPIPWNFSALATQTSSIPINVIYRLFDAEGNKVEKSVPLFLRSINDCIFQYQDKKFDFLFTAFIQEQHPEIDKILREALDTKFIS